ncbi:hypothetical protein KCP70_24575 [Salmonella enterica subsp. enterica]|nr:hypothetical protein KCP70_24575 [Salmonella enterica subsp. enterica]
MARAANQRRIKRGVIRTCGGDSGVGWTCVLVGYGKPPDAVRFAFCRRYGAPMRNGGDQTVRHR